MRKYQKIFIVVCNNILIGTLENYELRASDFAPFFFGLGWYQKRNREHMPQLKTKYKWNELTHDEKGMISRELFLTAYNFFAIGIPILIGIKLYTSHLEQLINQLQ